MPNELPPSETKDDDQDKRFKTLATLVKDEADLVEKHGRSRREQWRTYLKLYVNQRKHPTTVGDTLMFSTHQTILASLCNDRQSPRQVRRRHRSRRHDWSHFISQANSRKQRNTHGLLSVAPPGSHTTPYRAVEPSVMPRNLRTVSI